MGHTFARIIFHIIFSTKHRMKTLHKHIHEELIAYINGIALKRDAKIIKACAAKDHIHILISVKPIHTPSDIVMKIKANSSRWIHETYPELSNFVWQSGYGIFSVSQSNVKEVVRYIERQGEHHRWITFAEEIRLFLKKHGVVFDHKYYLD